MDNIDELIIDVALTNNGRKDYYAGRNIAAEMEAIAKGQEKIVKQNEKIAKSQERIKRTGFQLGRALKTLGFYFGFREIGKYADEWQRVANTLSQVTKTDKERVALQERLYQIGRRTRTSTTESSSLYMSLGSVGLSGQQQLNATEILQKAFKATGSNTRTIESIKRMLRTGKLSTLIGINTQFAEIIASGMNMSLEELQQRIKKGGFTSIQVLQALSNKSLDINKNFSKTKTTLSEALGSLKESGVRFFGRFEEKFGVFSKISKSVEILTDWVEILGDKYKEFLKIIGTGFGVVAFTTIARNFDLFIYNLKDGIGIIKSLKLALKGTFLANITKALWRFVLPLAKVYLILEAIHQTMLLISGQETIFHRLGEMAANLVHHGSTEDETFEQRQKRLIKQGKISPITSDTIMRLRQDMNQGGSGVVNINNNLTINESRNGLRTADHLLESSVKRVTEGAY